MSTPTIDLARTQALLAAFDFNTLFVEQLGWQQPGQRDPAPITVEGADYDLRYVATLSGFAVIEVHSPDGKVPDAQTCRAVYDAVVKTHHENVLIFVDGKRTLSDWYWVKREAGGRKLPRRQTYAQGQTGALILSKLAAIAVDIGELDESGNFPLVAVADRVKHALDVEIVTKKFYREYSDARLKFVEYIQGIGDEKDRRWYASVLLNRLMFIYFLQRKGFVDNADKKFDYLQRKLAESRERGPDRYYSEFLDALFFEGFAKPPERRDPDKAKLIGSVKYLNGGLFLPHAIEEKYEGKITVADAAFENILNLFASYSWNLDDTPGGQDDEINPDVLGYIFEKYINQKAFGAYYTKPEITEYLCDQTIHRLILDKVNAPDAATAAKAGLRHFDSIGDLVIGLDAPLCRKLLFEVLPGLSILDPACGSGAFLVAAMKTLIDVYVGVVGRIPFVNDGGLRDWLAGVRRDHPSEAYFIKRKIITDNLYGVDIMAEGAEIARLRLFLTLVSSARTVDELEPLPNIDFNILHGNSLIGLLSVRDLKSADQTGTGLMQLQGEIEERNRKIHLYKESSAYKENLVGLRDEIDTLRAEHYRDLNDVLRLEGFKGIKFEQATWDESKNAEGKPVKRPLTEADIEALEPFHWGYEFDEVMNQRGGFDAIITNPPWDIFKPNSKEFFQDYATDVTINKMTIKEFEARQSELLKQTKLRAEWLQYLSRFPHVSGYYRTAKQYENQISVVNGKKAGTDINLYKLFTEQCFNLLRRGGQCGIVIPSGIYTDLGTKQLRELLFGQTQVTGLFCFENGVPGGGAIFDNVHRSFKIVLLSFDKGGSSTWFPTAFMRHDVADLDIFPRRGALEVSVELIRRLSPDSLSLMEFQSELDVQIAEKMLQFSLLREHINGAWNLRLGNEFHMTNDSRLFQTSPAKDHLSLYEGKMIHQFTHQWSTARYWIDKSAGRKAILGRRIDTGRNLDYQGFRFAVRRIARSNDERTLIASVLPPNVFAAESFHSAFDNSLDAAQTLFVVGVFNSYVADSLMRQRVSANVSMYYIHQLPVPRLTAADPRFRPIVERAARLICTTPEFDDLAKEVGLKPLKTVPVPDSPSGQGMDSAPQLFASEQPALGDAPEQRPVYGVTDPKERANLRAELDAMVAHLYTLTEDEFAHILTTFPLVEQSVKNAALDEFRRQAPKAGDPVIAGLLEIKERHTLEFKECLRHNKNGQKDTSGENSMTKDVASFLNSPQGGTLLTGVTDDGEVVGIETDYPFLGNDGHQDGYHMSVSQALQNACGPGVMNRIEVTFHEHCGKMVCKLAVAHASQPVYWKEGGLNKFVIRNGNQSVVVQDHKGIIEYQNRIWPKL